MQLPLRDQVSFQGQSNAVNRNSLHQFHHHIRSFPPHRRKRCAFSAQKHQRSSTDKQRHFFFTECHVAHHHHYDHRGIWRFLPQNNFREDYRCYLGSVGYIHRFSHGGCPDQYSEHGPEREESTDRSQSSIGQKGPQIGICIAHHPLLQEVPDPQERKREEEGSPESRGRRPDVEHFSQISDQLPDGPSGHQVYVRDRRRLWVDDKAILVHKRWDHVFAGQSERYNW